MKHTLSRENTRSRTHSLRPTVIFCAWNWSEDEFITDLEVRSTSTLLFRPAVVRAELGSRLPGLPLALLSTLREMTVKSAALNPSSTPFFPPSMRATEEERSSGFSSGVLTSSSSALSTSPTDARSSPSPAHDHLSFAQPEVRFQSSAAVADGPSVAYQVELDRPSYFRTRDGNTPGGLEALPEGDDTSGSLTAGNGAQTPGDPSTFFSVFAHHSRGRIATPPVGILGPSSRSSSFNTNGPFVSSSPVSSLDSASQFTPSTDLPSGLEAQLRLSPFIQDVIERLIRCEFTTQEMQRELQDVHQKLNFLVERSLSTASGGTAVPEFKDPFAPPATSQSAGLNIPRQSLSTNIAPNQSPPSDDISQMSQRLNTLTTSVGQLLALQTQQHIQNATALGRITPDIPINQPFATNIGSSATLLGHGLPNRPDLRPASRTPHPPIRTWSAGTLDLPQRMDSVATIGRIEPPRDKRRSITGNAMRRESSVVSASFLSFTSDFDGKTR